MAPLSGPSSLVMGPILDRGTPLHLLRTSFNILLLDSRKSPTKPQQYFGQQHQQQQEQPSEGFFLARLFGFESCCAASSGRRADYQQRVVVGSLSRQPNMMMSAAVAVSPPPPRGLHSPRPLMLSQQQEAWQQQQQQPQRPWPRFSPSGPPTQQNAAPPRYQHQYQAQDQQIPYRRRSIRELVLEEGPEWNLLLTSGDGLFAPEDLIDEDYQRFLSEVLLIMRRNQCGFKRAMQLQHQMPVSNHAASGLGPQGEGSMRMVVPVA